MFELAPVSKLSPNHDEEGSPAPASRLQLNSQWRFVTWKGLKEKICFILNFNSEIVCIFACYSFHRSHGLFQLVEMTLPPVLQAQRSSHTSSSFRLVSSWIVRCLCHYLSHLSSFHVSVDDAVYVNVARRFITPSGIWKSSGGSRFCLGGHGGRSYQFWS